MPNMADLFKFHSFKIDRFLFINFAISTFKINILHFEKVKY